VCTTAGSPPILQRDASSHVSRDGHEIVEAFPGDKVPASGSVMVRMAMSSCGVFREWDFARELHGRTWPEVY
jgi:hypothetical protein